MVQIQFSLIKKIKAGRPEHSLSTHPLSPITSYFCHTSQLPPTSPQSGCHVCMTPNEKGTTPKIAQNKQKLFVICGPLEENLD